MKLRLILCTIILAVVLAKREALAQSKGPDERIYGGVKVPPGDAPFQVSFQINSGYHFCGGSIIDPNFIVTAAHCCVYAEASRTLKIAAGLNTLSTPEQGFQNITVARMIVHPDYGAQVRFSADICMLQLEHSLILSSERRTAVINLPPPGYTASGEANVTGWGQTDDNTSPDALMRVQIPIVPDNVCREKYGSDRIVDEMICAGATGKGGCYGDSGGPLIDSKGFMVGVVSWGSGCGSGTYPGVYTEVSYFTQWIKTVLVNSTLVDSVSS